MYTSVGHKVSHYREPGSRHIGIPCNETELKLVTNHFLSLTCRRRDELRTIRYLMNDDHAFSREDERALVELFQRIDRIVERNAIDMRRDAEKMLREPGWAMEKYLQRKSQEERLEAMGRDETNIPPCFDWSIGNAHEHGNDESLWPFRRRTGVRINVEIRLSNDLQQQAEEKWEIERDPGVICLSTDGFVQPEPQPDTLPAGEVLPARVMINGLSFPGETGLRILKLKHESCPFPKWQHAWDALSPLTFREIATLIRDVDRRRIAISFLGIERLLAEVESKMIKEETLEKLTTWVDPSGQIREHRFSDTYSLHRVRWTTLFGDLTEETNRLLNSNWNKPRNQHFVKCQCTSTGKTYILWVDLRQVYRTNHPEVTRQDIDDIGHWRIERLVDPIEAIAWTFETRLAKGSIESIIRQGDCILMRPVINPQIDINRHLTGEEYRTLLRAES